jgi:hypothetical protein
VIRVLGNDTGLLEIDRGAERIANEYVPRSVPSRAPRSRWRSWDARVGATETPFDPTGERTRA